MLGVEVNELENEQDDVLGGGGFALEEEIKNFVMKMGRWWRLWERGLDYVSGDT